LASKILARRKTLLEFEAHLPFPRHPCRNSDFRPHGQVSRSHVHCHFQVWCRHMGWVRR
jgi:hypothetical protein